MTIEETVNDPRLVARIVNLAERCGCRYRQEARVTNRGTETGNSRDRVSDSWRECRRSASLAVKPEAEGAGMSR